MNRLHDNAGLNVRDLGTMPYASALELQRQINLAVSQDHEPATLLLVEHPSVITLSRRKTTAEHLVATAAHLEQLGIDVQETDRGGDITYHGPGQLVAYPILRLSPLNLNLGRYMRWLEQIVIDTLTRWDIQGQREAAATGVWVQPGENEPQAKLCAMGVRVRKNTTMHGLALNVTTDLSHFQTIVPCGLAGRAVTSLQQLLGPACPTMQEVKAQLIHHFVEAMS